MSAETDDRNLHKRLQILEAARKRFIAEGYVGAGMEAVARDAMVSTATLYDHFASKADLFRCVAEAAIEAVSAPRPAAAPRGDLVRLLQAFALSYGAFLSDPSVRMLVRVFASERRRFAVVAQAFDARGREAFREALLAILDRLNREGRISTPKPDAAAAQLLGMIEHAALLEPLLVNADLLDQPPIDQVCEEAVATFLARYGVHAPAEAA